MKHLLLLFLLLSFAGCRNNKTDQPDDAAQAIESTETPDTLALQTEKFIVPEVPDLITDPALRRLFLAEHYWDNFDFSDTTYTPSPEITEQAWVNYIDLLHRTSLQQAQNAIQSMIQRSAEGSKKMFSYFTDMAGKYLYDSNSPIRDEELYIPVLEVMMRSNVLTHNEKMLPKYRLDRARKNRLHAKAIDFRYTDRMGKSGTLHRTDAEYLLLFFNEPGCPSCKDHIENIRRSAIMNQRTAEGRLKTLSIYTGDDLDEWKKHYGTYPLEWINGHDQSQKIEADYDLKAMPTLYLLDQNKTVLLKDATLGQIENYLFYNQ